MKIIDENLWKQALAKAASRFYNRSITISSLAGEAELLSKAELDVALLPDDYHVDELPEAFVEYAYSVSEDVFGYALVSEDCSELYVMGLVEGSKLVWFLFGGDFDVN